MADDAGRLSGLLLAVANAHEIGKSVAAHVGEVNRLRGVGDGEPRAMLFVAWLSNLLSRAKVLPYAFTTERRGSMTPAGFLKLLARIGEAAGMPFSIYPHRLRHSRGYKLADDGVDSRALQH